MAEPRLVVHCQTCQATWELDFEPVACRCDYDDPDALVSPWTWTLEMVEV